MLRVITVCPEMAPTQCVFWSTQQLLQKEALLLLCSNEKGAVLHWLKTGGLQTFATWAQTLREVFCILTFCTATTTSKSCSTHIVVLFYVDELTPVAQSRQWAMFHTIYLVHHPQSCNCWEFRSTISPANMPRLCGCWWILLHIGPSSRRADKLACVGMRKQRSSSSGSSLVESILDLILPPQGQLWLHA